MLRLDVYSTVDLRPAIFLYSIIAVTGVISAFAFLKVIVEPTVAPSILGYDGIQGGFFAEVPAVKPIYDVSPYLLPVVWGALVGTLAWKGRVKSKWKKHGYDYDTFKLVARMRGSPTRVEILRLVYLPKNKLQLAKELHLDWRTVDNHVSALVKNGLVQEMAAVGTSRYYIISEHGKNVLNLLSSDFEKDNA